jgi:hypothetical protein
MSGLSGNFAQFQKSKVNGHARITGLITCGSVWDCPVCSSKISMIREKEIRTAIDNWYGLGNYCLLVTYTVRHNKGDKLTDLSRVMTEGLRFVKSGRQYQEIKRDGIKGSITLTEITYGQNGWHYHKHILLFVKNTFIYELKNNQDKLQNVLVQRYRSYIESKGYTIVDGIGVTIEKVENNKLGQYFTKWGMSNELASDIKESNGGITPFQMLDDIDTWGNMFLEYSRTMYGKRRITFSNGLRAMLNMGEEKTDQEVLQEEDQDGQEYELIITVDRAQYKWINDQKLLPVMLHLLENNVKAFMMAYWKLIVPKRESDLIFQMA